MTDLQSPSAGSMTATLVYLCDKNDIRNIYSSKKVTHNILVYRQVQITVAVTCVLYLSYAIEYNE